MSYNRIDQIKLQPLMSHEERAAHREQARNEKRSRREGRFIGAATAVGVAAALAFFGTNDKEPVCHGTQTIQVTGGDRLIPLMQEHIDVTDGYVDLTRVNTTLTYEEHLPHGMIQERVVENPSTIHPGDILTMPQTCEG